MRKHLSSVEAALAAAVIVHLGVSLVHGMSHARANVALSPASMLFVWVVIMIGPVLGLVLQRTALPRTGAWLIAITLFGSFVFGLVNHFLIPGSDHVAHVEGPWRITFGVSAALLAVTEALGSALGVRCATGLDPQSRAPARVV